MTFDPHSLAHQLIDGPADTYESMFDLYVAKAMMGGHFTEEQAHVVAGMTIESIVGASHSVSCVIVAAMADIDPAIKSRCIRLLTEMYDVIQARQARQLAAHPELEEFTKLLRPRPRSEDN